MSREDLFAPSGLAKLAGEVERWYFEPKLVQSILKKGEGVYSGEVKGVKVEVSYDHFNGVEGEKTDRWKINARFNDTLLGESEYEHYQPFEEVIITGDEIVRQTYEDAQKRYNRDKNGFLTEDFNHARRIIGA